MRNVMRTPAGSLEYGPSINFNVRFEMKTCSECSMPASAASLQCGNCGSAMFTESTGMDDVHEREGRASYWSVLTWAVGYFILSTVVGLVFGLAAQFLGAWAS